MSAVQQTTPRTGEDDAALVWLIRYTGAHGEPRAVACRHNTIADFRRLDPDATVQVIDCAAVAELIASCTTDLWSPDKAVRSAARVRHAAALARCGGVS